MKTQFVFSLALTLVSVAASANSETICPNSFAEEEVVRYAPVDTRVCKITSNKPVQMNDQHQTNYVEVTCPKSKKVYSISMFKYPDDEYGDGGCGSFGEVSEVKPGHRSF